MTNRTNRINRTGFLFQYFSPVSSILDKTEREY